MFTSKSKINICPKLPPFIFFSKTGWIHHFKKIVNSPLVELFYSSERWQNDIQNLTLLNKKIQFQHISNVVSKSFQRVEKSTKSNQNGYFPPRSSSLCTTTRFHFYIDDLLWHTAYFSLVLLSQKIIVNR